MAVNKMNYVFDTSAWLAYIEEEPGADLVHEILEQTRNGIRVFLPFMSLMEVFYVSAQQADHDEAFQRVKIILSLPVTYVDSSVNWSIAAAEIKTSYKVSNADSWMAALANILGGTLVHKDPEFESLHQLIALYPLPYK